MSVPVQHPMYIDGQFVTWHDDAFGLMSSTGHGKRLSRVFPMGVPKTHVKRSMPRIALSRNGKRCLPLNGQTGYAKFLRVSASEPMKSAR